MSQKLIENYRKLSKVPKLWHLDALVVDYTREEQDSIRGRTNAWTYICSRVGTCIHYLIIGLALNSPAYGGTFCNIGVSYQHVLGVYSATGFIAAFCALVLTVDRSNKQTKESLSRKVCQNNFLLMVEFFLLFWRIILWDYMLGAATQL